MASSTELGKYLVKNAIEYFDDFSKDEWINIFDNLTSKLFGLLEIVCYKKWNSYSTAALLESLEKMISKGEFVNKNKWDYLIKSYESENIPLINVFKGIRDKFYSNRGLVGKESFSFFLHHFQEKNVLEDKPGDAFRTFFKVEFLDDNELLNLMINKSEFINHLMTKSQEHEVADFIQGVKDRYENSELVKSFAQRIGINISPVGKS
jgi:hypothetical protein